MATVLITGGTGLVGKPLTNLLAEKGYKVIILTRNVNAARIPGGVQAKRAGDVSFAQWDIEAQTFENNAFEEADYIIHLAGAGIADKRWSEKRKKEIRESRTKGSELLIKALRQTPNKVKAVVSASAIGWYGEDPKIPNPRPFVETDPPDFAFLGETCKQWEESIQPVTAFGKRLVILRTGIALSNEGGAFEQFKRPVKFGVAGIIGNGKQVISWIHIDDLCRVYLDAIENEELRGVYNAVAPKPVSNKRLTLEMAKVLKKNFFVPMHVPPFILRMMLGELSIEILKSTTVSCEKLRITGFDFIFPSIEAALHDLC